MMGSMTWFNPSRQNGVRLLLWYRNLMLKNQLNEMTKKTFLIDFSEFFHAFPSEWSFFLMFWFADGYNSTLFNFSRTFLSTSFNLFRTISQQHTWPFTNLLNRDVNFELFFKKESSQQEPKMKILKFPKSLIGSTHASHIRSSCRLLSDYARFSEMKFC